MPLREDTRGVLGATKHFEQLLDELSRRGRGVLTSGNRIRRLFGASEVETSHGENLTQVDQAVAALIAFIEAVDPDDPVEAAYEGMAVDRRELARQARADFDASLASRPWQSVSSLEVTEPGE